MSLNRKVIHRAQGSGAGPIRRLMSPGDLGEHLKPFVFLDLFEFPGGRSAKGMPLHPHSGIATVTLFVRGEMHFDDAACGTGLLNYGAVEFVRAGVGIWHGQELSAGDSPLFQGFQMWLALPPEMENAPPESQYIEASKMPPALGPARLILGEYQGQRSPVRAPEGITYLLVTLAAGERWTFTPNRGETVAWLAVASGQLGGATPAKPGEIVVFEPGSGTISLEAGPGAPVTFVLGAARPHDYPLCLGQYSVHTSPQALRQGEARIREIGEAIARQSPEKRGGATPVVR